jgi:hypothetical protein
VDQTRVDPPTTPPREVAFSDVQVRAVLAALDEWLRLYEDVRPPSWVDVRMAADRMRIGLL